MAAVMGLEARRGASGLCRRPRRPGGQTRQFQFAGADRDRAGAKAAVERAGEIARPRGQACVLLPVPRPSIAR